MIPGSTTTHSKSISEATKLVDVCQKQKETLAWEYNEDTSQQLIDDKIDKDVFLFKGEKMKGASYLTKRNSPYSGMRFTTEDYEKGFEWLAGKGLDEIVVATATH